MQLDAEEDADVFYKPPVIPLTRSGNDDLGRISGETQVEAAAVTTAEQED
jgi:hypothetical protein